MRQIFKDVPVIYGFSSTAPLGPVAASSLNRYFRAQGDREIAQGRPSNRLLDTFAAFGMSSARGITDKDAHAEARREMCQFADERLSTATKLAFVHQLLQRHFGEARLHLDRIQRLMAGLDDRTRRTPAVAQALEDIGRDAAARTRWLEQARETEQPSVRVRLIDLARDVGWLSEAERRQELALMLRELLARTQCRRARGQPGVQPESLSPARRAARDGLAHAECARRCAARRRARLSRQRAGACPHVAGPGQPERGRRARGPGLPAPSAHHRCGRAAPRGAGHRGHGRRRRAGARAGGPGAALPVGPRGPAAR